MKFFVVFGVLCLVALSTQVPLFEGCDEKVQKVFDKESCGHVQCYNFSNETVTVNKMSYNSCAIPSCEGGLELKGQNPEDVTKTYPDCCATPICE
ncbi:hypothetical protein TSAR_011123 [Trichomalopsis sarcophagae]|uniref:Single domain-containing protein n=1 Tax=Trichomalopsis sarcophagae TaxID=543379 RepID=A0A232FGA7_9HYME|nr:hypothetical protein TSAR_011123 [Trichomalopsis sarcophagae]